MLTTPRPALTLVPPARHLLRAKDLIDARYRDPLDVPAIARAAHLSPAHFSRETLFAKGAAGGLFFSTDDCRATYEELKDRGVEFTEEPSERPHGSDAAFRDPSGNQIRMVQTT